MAHAIHTAREDPLCTCTSHSNLTDVQKKEFGGENTKYCRICIVGGAVSSGL